MKRKQSNGRGTVYSASGKWYVRYCEDQVTIVNGERITVHVKVSSPPLATTAEVRNKGEARKLADEFLNNLRTHAPSALGTIEIVPFVETVYFPWLDTQVKAGNKEASTAAGYRDLWNAYFCDRLRGIRLRDFRTCDGEKLMERIAAEEKNRQGEPLAKNTLKHAKSFLSGVFTHARRQGYLNGINPMMEVSTPVAEEDETYAYSIEEELQMLLVLPPGPGQLAVALASFSGLSKSEMRGLKWEDYDGEVIQVRRKLWRHSLGKTKTHARKAAVPVIAQLKRYLDKERKENGWVLRRETGEPWNLDWETRTIVRPAVEAAGLAWHGWHAFRRALGTNLHHLGVDDKTIQAILRHSVIATTQKYYVKTLRKDVVAAMQELERTLEVQAKGVAAGKEQMN